jgi:hypothetical protein
MLTTSTPVSDVTMFDCLNNSCRAELHHVGRDQYELYLHDFNDSTPRRFVGGLGELMARGQMFLDAKEAGGFTRMIHPDCLHAWRA